MSIRTQLLLALAVFALVGCSEKSSKPTGEPAAAPQEKQADEPAEPALPVGPTGVITGVAKLIGEAPEMKPLKRGSDSFCARTEALQETVVTDETGGLANVLVRIAPGGVKGPMPKASVVVEQDQCMYRPRVVGAVRGQDLELRNQDGTFHNIHARVRGLRERQGIDTVFNRGQPSGGQPITQKLPEVDLIELKCDVHGWMKGFIVITDHPYFSVTGSDGAFRIEGVPVGEYRMQAWHELYGVVSAKVIVEEGKTAEVSFEYKVPEADNAEDGAKDGEEK